MRGSAFLSTDERNSSVCLYHPAFREFLLNNGRIKLFPHEAHADIASYFIGEFAGRWTECDDNYARQHTVTHLWQALTSSEDRKSGKRLADSLFGLLNDPSFVEAYLTDGDERLTNQVEAVGSAIENLTEKVVSYVGDLPSKVREFLKLKPGDSTTIKHSSRPNAGDSQEPPNKRLRFLHLTDPAFWSPIQE